jgi:hypothetical protein
MTNPQIAIACLIGLAVVAGFYFVEEYSKCRQEHPAGYNCFPPVGRLARR